MSESTKAVFLSYARDDAAAARRVAEALRSSGLEVWFDENELRGGDAWDQKIRRQIGDCTLFLPIISQHTQERGKGYFRLEWKLAVEQTHLMAEGVPFLAPVVIDDTRETGAVVPPEFMRVQWTRLPGALPTPQFVAQIKRLLEAHTRAGAVASVAQAPSLHPVQMAGWKPALRRVPAAAWIAAGVVLMAALYGWLRPAVREMPPPATAKPATETKPPPAAAAKSIAVLPFANLSTDKENEFFADGVHDDVITNLAKIRDLKVISRTSVLAYRDPAARNLKKIAAELGVAAILEGSIRRVGSKVHMNAQLIDARTDEHLWADTFDGDTGDIFALQASLAQKIAAALKATLTPGERTLIELRPTQNQEAYELYSRARILQERFGALSKREEYENVIALLDQAVAKDPAFALAYANLSMVHGLMYWFGAVDPTPERRQKSLDTLNIARRLAPTAPETHLAQGSFSYICDLDWQAALAEYALAEPNLPNDAQLLYRIGLAHRRLAQWPETMLHFERAAALNPHDNSIVSTLVDSNFALRRYAETCKLAAHYLTVFPADVRLLTVLLRAQYALDGDGDAFIRGWAAPRAGADERDQLQVNYEVAMYSGDLVAAERILADPRLTFLGSFGGTINEDTASARALVACLRGDHEAAAKFAAEAIAHYRHHSWTRRQQPTVLMAIAAAEAYVGRAEEAARDGREALAQQQALDAFSAIGSKRILGGLYALLGRRDEALTALRHLVRAADGTSPNDYRHDPLWSRLNDDPRFEEILRSAKPL